MIDFDDSCFLRDSEKCETSLVVFIRVTFQLCTKYRKDVSRYSLEKYCTNLTIKNAPLNCFYFFSNR